ncbi:phosphotransferase [Brachybacterium sp. AOP3-A1-3]|uniref:phosphotransferase n=1 Tax=Brachybacterium sp. AOP3-A1-3 TaxID=3457699 RepID=UPI0040333862
MADEFVSVTSKSVSRDRRDWSATVHRLLSHLAGAGLDGLPIPLAEQSPELDEVSYVEGATAIDVVLSRAQVESFGRLLRSLHDAGADFDARPTDVWQPFEFRASAPDPFSESTFLSEIVIGHGDTGPWNVLVTSAESVSLIDWEFAGPIVRLDEIAATSWLALRFHDPEVDAVAPLTNLEEKVELLSAFLDGYRLDRTLWPAVVRGMSDYAIRDTAYEAIRLSISANDAPADDAPADDSAQWRLAWRSRSAAWIIRHRAEILHLLGV